MNYLKNTLTVDPGLETGWAFWTGSFIPVTGSIKPVTKSENFVLRMTEVIMAFRRILMESKPSRIIIEDQWFSEHSMTSLTSAKTGAMKKLAWMTGALLVSCARYAHPELIAPMRWKGNMNDDAVRYRVHLVTGIHYPNCHIADAVGIGLNEMNVFIKVPGIHEDK